MRIRAITTVAAVLAISGCAATRTPENIEPAADGGAYQAQYRSAEDDLREARNARSAALNAKRCAPDAISPLPAAPAALLPEALSPGDLLTVVVGTDTVFTGSFEVSTDGVLRLPHLSEIPVRGRDAAGLEMEIAERLVSEGLYRRLPRVSVRLTDPAGARVLVAGAVFQPGQHGVGGGGGRDRDTTRQLAMGTDGGARSLSAALRAAGGVRPDADLANVRLVRAGKARVLDMRGALAGHGYDDATLVTGDWIEVPSLGCFQEALMVSGAISPPGVSVYMSNLTKPADANALSAIGRDTRQMPYGTRFLQAAVTMNCVGGTQATNADRSAVLFSRNPITGQSVVIERRLEDLLRRADRDELDPFLMPGDAIACYDSTVTNITDVARSVATVLGTGILLAL